MVLKWHYLWGSVHNERRMHSSIQDLSKQEFYRKQGSLVINKGRDKRAVTL